MTDDGDLLSIKCESSFLMTESGQLERQSDPDHSPAPRFSLAGCKSGNWVGVCFDVTDGVAAEILALAATEPPFVTQDGAPKHLERYIEILSREAPVSRRSLGVIYHLPNHLGYAHRVRLIHSESEEGKRLRASLLIGGMPPGLLEMGFRDISEFWEPWCVALHDDGQIASVAFAARLSDRGADLGVATVQSLRGRGYAAAATAGWTGLPSLQSRALFYSTDQTNVSSRRVIARLRLRFIGGSLGLT
ncbi:MAG: GNAT family N-acetyltransferase [Candidatus Binataceae bacterium]